MGVFSNIKKAKATKGGDYIQPGNYLFEIQRVKLQDNQTDENTKWFVVEVKVLEAQQTNDEVKPNAVGTEPAWLVEVPKNADPEKNQKAAMALGNVKAFLESAFGALAVASGETPPDEEDIDGDFADAAVSEDNPLAGTRITANAFYKKTKKNTNFTRVKWGIPDSAE